MIAKFDMDEALMAQVEAAAKARGMSFREFIREALHHAVNMPAPAARPAPFFQKVHDFGAHLETPWIVLADLETEGYAFSEGKK
jgi:hypothetical protein